MRRKPGEHLSQDGIALARLVGEASGPFNLVVTSTSPRAIETAIAMGFEVHETLDAIAPHLPEEALRDRRRSGPGPVAGVGWPAPFATFADEVASGGQGAMFARLQATLWRSAVEQLGESQSALIVTHGGLLEYGAVASVPDADHSGWGGAAGYCEGVRLSFENGTFTRCEVLRVPPDYHLVEN